jgi:hypothetical protein
MANSIRAAQARQREGGGTRRCPIPSAANREIAIKKSTGDHANKNCRELDIRSSEHGPVVQANFQDRCFAFAIRDQTLF